MTRHSKTHRCCAVIWIMGGAVFVTALLGGAPLRAQDETPAPEAEATPAPIQPVKTPSGPSARKAALLEKGTVPPGKEWLLHYLPDDRYKIDGKVWKYVSTELDTYYHLPDSPLMLKQQANMVIGFSSQAQAEEAGYRPDATVQAQIRKAQLATIVARGPRPFSKPTTVTLGDGHSLVTVPAGWTHIASPLKMPNFSFDMFYPKGVTPQNVFQMPKRGQRYVPPRQVMIMTMTNPRGQSMEGMVQHSSAQKDVLKRHSESLDEFGAGLNTQNPQMGQFFSLFKELDVQPSNWGGVRAVRWSAKKGSKNAALIGSSIIAARGPKMYMFSDTTRNAKGASQLRNSFVAR